MQVWLLHEPKCEVHDRYLFCTHKGAEVAGGGD